MTLTRKYFPVDIFSVKEYGIKKWQDEFFWPVSDGEFLALYENIEQCFMKHVNTQPQEISDLLLIQRDLFFGYCHFLHATKVIGEIKSRGLDVLCSNSTPLYGKLTTGTSITNGILGKRRTQYDHSSDGNFARKIKSDTKRFVKSFIHNPNPFKFLKSVGKSETVFTGSVDPMITQYIKRLPSWVSFKYPWNWLPEDVSYRMPGGLESNIENVSSTIINELRAIAEKNNISILDSHIDDLRQLTKRELMNSAKILCLVKSKINGGIHLLITGLGNPFNRILCIAVRQSGGNVTSFSHGAYVGYYDSPTFALSEFAISDEFITYTPESVKLFDKIKSNHPPLRNNRVNIDSCESNEFSRIWQKNRNKLPPESIKRIMIIGYPHTSWRKPQATASLSLMHLDLELRLVNILKEAGYEVFYKAHPDRLPEIDGIFYEKAKVLKGYFQDYMDMADVILFGCIRTTAFSIALCTNKPIIGFIVEPEHYKPFPEVIELFKKRCRLIYAEFDERNRIVFDKDELLDALCRRPDKSPNTEFIEKYMFPANLSTGS